MKLFLAFLLCFAIFSDLSLVCGESEELHQETSVSLSHDNNTHHSEQKNDSSHTDCHCHQGHSHSFPLSIAVSDIKTPFRKINNSYPDFLLSKIQNFHLDIIRPPILS